MCSQLWLGNGLFFCRGADSNGRQSSNSFHISVSMGQLWCKSKLSLGQESYEPQHGLVLFSSAERVTSHAAFRCHLPSEKSLRQSRCSLEATPESFRSQGEWTVRLILEVFHIKTISVIVLGTGSKKVFYSLASQAWLVYRSPGDFVKPQTLFQ